MHAHKLLQIESGEPLENGEMNQMALPSGHRIRSSGYADIRGLVKFKKIKNPRETRIGQTPPTHRPIHFFYFFGNMYNNNKIKIIFPKRKESEMGLDPPTHFRIFLGFLDFSNLTKPLRQSVLPFDQRCSPHYRLLFTSGQWRNSFVPVNPNPAKLFYFNFQPLKFVSRYRDPQLRVV